MSALADDIVVITGSQWVELVFQDLRVACQVNFNGISILRIGSYGVRTLDKRHLPSCDRIVLTARESLVLGEVDVRI